MDRLDVLLFNLGLAKSREKAKQMIISNTVYVNGKLVNKPSSLFDEQCEIKIDLPEVDYVSRAAFKLKKAVENFNINLKNKICVDVGASTGGFTDFMLKGGCSFVYAIDSGQDQLVESLLNDNRVLSLERTNLRYVDVGIFKEKIDFICVDVSFISLELIIPKIVEICNENTEVVALIKPQFEVGKGNVGKNGIVKDKKMHVSVLERVYKYFYDNKLYINDIVYSPITGGDGNIEYLVYARRDKTNANFEDNLIEIIKNLTNEAFKSL
jgi:23S rRNA (cytidine1920-2'-O)/16S rRNA (cytidine1409-2'-O)-methyltransferase